MARKTAKQIRAEMRRLSSRKGSLFVKKPYRQKKQFISSRRQIVPLKTIKTLRYVEDISLQVAVGDVPVTQFFTCNGLQKPHVGGSTHQPMGFDVIMPQYDHYVGLGATITATFTSTDVSTGGLARVGVMLKDSSSVAFNGNTHLLEQQRCITRHLGTMGSDKGVQVVRWKVNPNDFLTRSKPLSDPDLKGDSASTPAEQCYFVVWACGITTTDTPSAILCEIQIEYTAAFIEPKLLAQS